MATMQVQSKEPLPDVYKNSHWPIKKTETRQLSNLPKHLKVQRSFFYVLLETRMARSKHAGRDGGGGEIERERSARLLHVYMWPQQNVSPGVRWQANQNP